MDWGYKLAELGIDLIRPTVIALSVWISAPSIVRIINALRDWKWGKKERKNEDKNEKQNNEKDI